MKMRENNDRAWPDVAQLDFLSFPYLAIKLERLLPANVTAQFEFL
jgi:hypothetical protein